AGEGLGGGGHASGLGLGGLGALGGGGFGGLVVGAGRKGGHGHGKGEHQHHQQGGKGFFDVQRFHDRPPDKIKPQGHFCYVWLWGLWAGPARTPRRNREPPAWSARSSGSAHGAG